MSTDLKRQDSTGSDAHALETVLTASVMWRSCDRAI